MTRTLMPMPFRNWSTYPGHGGIDWAQRKGTPIPSITDGVVAFLGWWGRSTPAGPAGGITRTVTRADGLQIMFCHLADFSGPRVGQRVKFGQDIGPVGSTGFSTGPHLHVEMWKNGLAQNEWDWMDKNDWIGKEAPAGGGGSTPILPNSGGSKMFIAVRKGAWYLVVPQGSKNYAIVLGGQDKRSGGAFPIIEYVWDTSWNEFKKTVANASSLPA